MANLKRNIGQEREINDVGDTHNQRKCRFHILLSTFTF